MMKSTKLQLESLLAKVLCIDYLIKYDLLPKIYYIYTYVCRYDTFRNDDF